jgi:uncharacterized protein (UPF0333 family)
MSKKIITGAVIALAAGLATYFYRKNRTKINEVASNAYDKMNDAANYAEHKADNIFS